MQKSAGYILLVTGFLLIAFLVGFFVGRNSGHSPILTSKVPTSASQSSAVEKININTATLEQLQTLPGIGETIAKRILQYRADYGPFEKVEDLTHVDGIGLDKLAQIIDYVTV